jgi:dTDP-4-amino-4,6-dideoxygalactose transaminase
VNGNGAIPFLDLVTPHRELRQELTEVFQWALDTAGFVGGPMVEQFETAFARFCGTKYCVGVGSGTDALRFALMATGVKAGDIVITVPNTFIATAEAISQAGAEPRFVDIDARTYNMDPAKVREYLENSCTVDDRFGVVTDAKTGKPVTAIVPVHLYGQMADMDALLDIAEQYKLSVVEDACQAHGARYFSRKGNRWRTAGSMGKAAAFSFYPGKNLGACGEAGAVTTDDTELAGKVRMLRDHGQPRKYHHDLEGYNGRLDAIQAGFLQVKLAYLGKWNEQRRERAAEYNRLLSCNEAVTCPYEPSWSHAVHHLYVIGTADRDGMIQHLKAAGIGTGIHYPVPLHMQKPYLSLNYRPNDFPVASRVAVEIVSLPMFPQLTSEQQARVADEVLRFVQNALISL